MKILYVGDVMGEPGLQVVKKCLSAIKKEEKISAVIAQAENTTEGRGISVKDFNRLQKIGVDFCSGGNWSLYRSEILAYLENPKEPIIRPANYPLGTAGLGYKYLETPEGKLLIVSLLGAIIGRDADKPTDNPLHVIDKILKQEENTKRAGTIVNFHGDYSSEKLIVGYYLDGRVSAVIGDHWHIPTADAEVLPKGTAHITDIGMCGSLDSSLGITLKSVLPRWYDGRPTHNVLETSGRMQFNALVVEINPQSGLAQSVRYIRKVF